MNDLLNNLKQLASNHRFLTVIIIAWIAFSNLLYFSIEGDLHCLNLTTFTGSSEGEWIYYWHKLTFGYIPLYNTNTDTGFSGRSMLCSQYEHNSIGHLAFILLPIALLVLITYASNWVKQGKTE